MDVEHVPESPQRDENPTTESEVQLESEEGNLDGSGVSIPLT